MTPTLLFVIGLAFALCAWWPFGPYQLSLVIARRLRRFAPAPDPTQTARTRGDDTFAICLCAYNEAAVIVDKVEDLLRLREAAGGDLEILIYVDGATDRTASILNDYRDRIRLVVESERRGKTHGMNLLVRLTRASIVMFTDANVWIDPRAVAVLRRYFADPSIGCVTSNLSYVNASQSATASVGSTFWLFNEWSKGLETDTGSVIGADGSLFAIRRELHRQVPEGLIDDLFVSLSVLFAGYRVVRAPDLRTFETHTTAAVDEFRRKVRIACQCMRVHFALWPELRRLDPWNLYKYVAHRLLRWVGGYFLLVAVVLLAAAAAVTVGTTVVFAIGGASVLLFSVAVRAGFSPATTLWNAYLALAGAAVGVCQAFLGKRAVTWEPLASARDGRTGGQRAPR